MFGISRSRYLPSSMEPTGRQYELKNRRAISGTFSGAPSTTDDSRDLDQLTVAEAMPAGASKILVAIEAHAGRGPKSSGRPEPCRFTPKPTLVRISFPTT